LLRSGDRAVLDVFCFRGVLREDDEHLRRAVAELDAEVPAASGERTVRVADGVQALAVQAAHRLRERVAVTAPAAPTACRRENEGRGAERTHEAPHQFSGTLPAASSPTTKTPCMPLI